MDDKEILELYRSGQRESAFNKIVDKYSEKLYWLVRRFLCSHEDTDDMLQEIFVKIWESLPNFRGESKLYTWLYTIATNQSLNFLHKKKVRAALNFKDLTAEMENKVDTDIYFNGDEAHRLLIKAMLKLPEKQRTVFNLKYFEELSYEDMSEILGTSVGALKASYHFACEKLRSELGKYSK